MPVACVVGKRQELERCDCYHGQWACYDMNRDMSKAEGLHRKKATWRMNADLLLAIETNMRRVEKLEYRHLR